MSDLEKRVAALEAIVGRMAAAFGGGKAEKSVASDDELDGQYGDPVVRKDPPKWSGESYEGRKFSDCPAKYLLSMAGFLEWRAVKEAADPAKAKYATYSRKDAARARGWAARVEARSAKYGTSGHGANAKHTLPPEVPFETADLEENQFPF